MKHQHPNAPHYINYNNGTCTYIIKITLWDINIDKKNSISKFIPVVSQQFIPSPNTNHQLTIDQYNPKLTSKFSCMY